MDFIQDNTLLVKLNKSFKRQLLANCIFSAGTEGLVRENPILKNYFDFLPELTDNDSDCLFGLGDAIKEVADVPQKRERNPQDIAYENAMLEKLRTWSLSNNDLYDWLAYRKKKAPIIAVQRGMKDTCFFRGLLKGIVEYSVKEQARLMHDAYELKQRYKHMYFLTYTFDAKGYSADRVDAWKNYTKDLSDTLDALKHVYDMGYMWVTESTARGYPHAHIVLFCNEVPDPQHLNYTEPTVISSGKLYQWVKTHAPAPQFKLEWAQGNNAVYYLQKYIAKCTSKKMYEKPNPKDKKACRTWRKGVLTMLCPTITHRRGYGCSQYKKVPLLDNGTINGTVPTADTVTTKIARTFSVGAKARCFNWEFLFNPPPDGFFAARWFAEWHELNKAVADPNATGLRRAVLDRLLTNSESKCGKVVRLLFGGQSKAIYDRLLMSESVNMGEMLDEYMTHSCGSGCQDCPLKRLYARRAGFDVPIDPRYPVRLKNATFTVSIANQKDMQYRPVKRDYSPLSECTAPADIAGMVGEVQPGEGLGKDYAPASPVSFRQFAQTEAERRNAGQFYTEYARANALESRKNYAEFKRQLEAYVSANEAHKEELQAIKEARIDKAIREHVKPENCPTTYLVRLRKTRQPAGSSNALEAWLKVGELSANEVLPSFTTTPAHNTATEILSYEWAEIFMRTCLQTLKDFDSAEIVLTHNRELVADGVGRGFL